MVHLANIFGALPATAREYSERDDIYKNELPEDQALVMMIALMMDGRTEIPAFWIPTVKAEDLAPTPPLVRRLSLKGQMIPMARTEPI